MYSSCVNVGGIIVVEFCEILCWENIFSMVFNIDMLLLFLEVDVFCVYGLEGGGIEVC